MERIIKSIALKLGFEIRRCNNKGYESAVVSLKPKNVRNGNVLLSYIIEPFLLKDEKAISNAHTHDWESFQMAKTFLEIGYSVDIIDYRNENFIPQKKYAIFVSARTNFERIARLLNKDCLKIVHLDTAHWLFNNHASYSRSLALQERKGMTIISQRIVESNLAIEYADYATILGNQFTIGTYEYAQKPIFRVPISTCVVYPWPENKNYEVCRKHFLWFGSSGFVHKGLDLVLDAFVEMPDYHLTVCGPVQKEQDFERNYYKELYKTPNIHTIGWVDVDSPEFIGIANSCIGLIYPSCSEGGGGSVITCMHAGLIPIVSYESSVDVSDYGVILKDFSVNEMKNAVQDVSCLSVNELKQMSRDAWEFARSNHTREKFAEEYKKVIGNIIELHRNRNRKMTAIKRDSITV